METKSRFHRLGPKRRHGSWGQILWLRFRLGGNYFLGQMVEGGKAKGKPLVAEAGQARDKAAAAVNLGRTTAERRGAVGSSGQKEACFL